jgi:hypothetical protein
MRSSVAAGRIGRAPASAQVGGVVLHCLHAGGGQDALGALGQEPLGCVVPALRACVAARYSRPGRYLLGCGTVTVQLTLGFTPM